MNSSWKLSFFWKSAEISIGRTSLSILLTTFIFAIFLFFVRMIKIEGSTTTSNSDSEGGLVFVPVGASQYSSLLSLAKEQTPYLGIVPLNEVGSLYPKGETSQKFLKAELFQLEEIEFRPFVLEEEKQKSSALTPVSWRSVLVPFKIQREPFSKGAGEKDWTVEMTTDPLRDWEPSVRPKGLKVPETPLVYMIHLSAQGEVQLLFPTRSPLKQSELRDWSRWLKQQKFPLADPSNDALSKSEGGWGELKIYK